MRAIDKKLIDELTAMRNIDLEQRQKAVKALQDLEATYKRNKAALESQLIETARIKAKTARSAVDNWLKQQCETMDFDDESQRRADKIHELINIRGLNIAILKDVDYVAAAKAAMRHCDQFYFDSEVNREHQKFYDDNGGMGPFDDAKVLESCKNTVDKRLNDMRRNNKWYDVTD